MLLPNVTAPAQKHVTDDAVYTALLLNDEVEMKMMMMILMMMMVMMMLILVSGQIETR